MANGQIGDTILGYFTEKTYGNNFEFKTVECEWLEKQGCTHEIAVGAVHGSPYRGAKLLKTVVHVLVDIDDEGENVWQKWQIKRVDFNIAA